MPALPPGVSRCALYDREFPSAMLCPDCVMGGEADGPSTRFVGDEAMDSVKIVWGFMADNPLMSDEQVKEKLKGMGYSDAVKRVNGLRWLVVDGLTVRECLERFSANQQWCDSKGMVLHRLTTAQKDAARAAWSAELRAKVEAGKQEAFTVSVDDDRWEP